MLFLRPRFSTRQKQWVRPQLEAVPINFCPLVEISIYRTLHIAAAHKAD